MSKKIGSINLTHLTNGAHYQFLTYALERLEALAPTVKTRFAADVTAFENALANENEFLVVSQKSMLTDDISLADQQRDAFYIGYKGLIKSFLNVSEGELLNAAKVLWQHLTDYGINTRMQFDRETGLLANMLEDLTGKYSEQVELLGAKGIVDRIKEANDKVASLIAERDSEYATRVVGGTKAARKVSDAAYRALVEKINAAAILEGEENYAAYIDEMNARIARLKREVLGQKPSSGTDSDQPTVPDDTQEPGTGEGDDQPTVPEEPEEPEEGEEEESDGPAIQ